MKKKIIITIILFCIGLIVIIILNNLLSKKYSNEDFNIKTYISNLDQDSDGIDDQSDILNNAFEYVEKRPKYKSKYYSTGYSNDEYGVCSDVVAISLKNAGYDLMNLVNEHILKNKELYDIEVVDKNIDFRRVINLNVYFKNTAITLTNDINIIDEWQGGDIVVFKHHIGIVSNHRNKRGIPYIIHHANIFQMNYEEDILEHRNDIIGHYRIS